MPSCGKNPLDSFVIQDHHPSIRADDYTNEEIEQILEQLIQILANVEYANRERQERQAAD